MGATYSLSASHYLDNLGELTKFITEDRPVQPSAAVTLSGLNDCSFFSAADDTGDEHHETEESEDLVKF